ncbi:response regulator transcription factor [Marinobacter sp. NFXS9]|uniref:response regulator transcription factor n=1 Tax=Marinobacter sp. NFXS9 TaxID=2818433 RepID=UPI0032DEC46C
MTYASCNERRVVLFDDHDLVREGLKLMIEAIPDFRVIAEGEDGGAVPEIVGQAEPDVVLMDISMHKVTGLDALRTLREQQNPTPVIMLSMHREPNYVINAFRLGANGYLLKDSAAKELHFALDSVCNQQLYVSPGISESVVGAAIGELDAPEPSPLTGRQNEILRLIALGRATKEIAWDLGLSAKTVESHRAQIMERLSIRDIAGLVRYAIRNGLISLDDV